MRRCGPPIQAGRYGLSMRCGRSAILPRPTAQQGFAEEPRQSPRSLAGSKPGDPGRHARGLRAHLSRRAHAQRRRQRSDGDRTGLVVGYCAGWLRTYEEQFLAYPREVAREFPVELQHLIGYRHHRPNLGNWEGQDPIAYLRDDGPCGPHRDALPPAIAAELKVVMAAADD